MRRILTKIFAAAVVVASAAMSPPLAGHAQSGGAFGITQSVIAGGGATSTDAGNVFSIIGTVGQPNAGDSSSGDEFNLKSGFWTSALAPTAAGAVVSGRVTVGLDVGIHGAVLTLIGGTTPKTSRTNNFGYFSFEDIEVGRTYLLSVEHKRYGFSQPTIVFTLVEDLTGISFEADTEN